MKYARAVLRQASDALKIRESTIQVRLGCVAQLLKRLDDRDFSDDLRGEFRSIKDAFPAVGGKTEAGFSAMNDETAKSLAERIHKLSKLVESCG